MSFNSSTAYAMSRAAVIGLAATVFSYNKGFSHLITQTFAFFSS